MIDDAQYPFVEAAGKKLWDMPSIFYQLDAAFPLSVFSTPPNWKVYFHDYSISMLTVPYVMAAATSPYNGNVAAYDNTDWGGANPSPLTSLVTLGTTPLGQPGSQPVSTFIDDLMFGNLPKYSFIEPRYSNGVVHNANPPINLTPNPNVYPPNSNHPGASNYPNNALETPLNPVSSTNPPIDVANGEAFLQQLYNALCESKYWTKTLLIITYDEHGGCYDHVPPPVLRRRRVKHPAPPSGKPLLLRLL